MGRTQSIGEVLNNVTMNNVVKQSLTNNVQCYNNVGMWKTQKDRSLWKTNRITPDEAEAKARFLVERLNAPQSRNFFLKCIYHLSEAEIQTALDGATKPYVRHSAKYFSRVAKIMLNKHGI